MWLIMKVKQRSMRSTTFEMSLDDWLRNETATYYYN
jgi:hypothetical protein